MTLNESPEERSERILGLLNAKYPGKDAFDVDGEGLHFACEIEPTEEHPEYDRAVEVVVRTKPHKHHLMTQYYRVLSGTLELHVEDQVVFLKEGDTCTVKPSVVHWSQSDNECWVELQSEPGWTREDHIMVDIEPKR